MNFYQIWHEQMMQKEIEKQAYALAKNVHICFGQKIYGSPSYYHSLAERIQFVKRNADDIAEDILAVIRKEKQRNRVASYWAAVDETRKTTLYERTEQVLMQEAKSKVAMIMYNYGLSFAPQDAKTIELYTRFLVCFWDFLADNIAMEEKKDGNHTKK